MLRAADQGVSVHLQRSRSHLVINGFHLVGQVGLGSRKRSIIIQQGIQIGVNGYADHRSRWWGICLGQILTERYQGHSNNEIVDAAGGAARVRAGDCAGQAGHVPSGFGAQVAGDGHGDQ